LVRPALGVAEVARFGPAFAALGAMAPKASSAGADPALGGLRYLHAVPHCRRSPTARAALLARSARAARLGLAPRARLAAVAE